MAILRIFIISIFIFPASIQASSFAKSDLEIIKLRVIEEMMKPRVDDTQIEKLISTFKVDGTWPGINYKDVSREGFEHRNHLGNMVVLARAYKTKTSTYYKNRKVKEAVERALENWVENDYICDNWWHNQLGTPNALVTLMLIIGYELPDALVKRAQPIIGRANIDAPGARPGGDRIKISGVQAKNALFVGDKEIFDVVIRVIESEIKYVEWIGMEYGYSFRNIQSGFENRTAAGRGIQYDNSFHHRTDGVNNTLSYGLSYAEAFVEWAAFTNGTQYSFSDKKLEQLIDYYLDGICKTAVYGKFPDAGAKNRSISREHSLRAFNSSAAEQLLQTTDYRKKEIQEIIDVRNKNIKPTLSHATFFWHSEHFSFQRPAFFTSVRMYSTRIYNMEVPYNSEGLLNHYRGDGVNHISVTGDEYYDIWPVYDYLKIPGATITQRKEMLPPSEIQKSGLTNFVGAVTNGLYGAAAFDFKSPHDPLCARKSWFFFDEEYVCLGAGISTREKLPVVTTINQSLLRSDVSVSINSKASVIEKSEKQYDHVDWVFHDGIGYVFPRPTSVNLKNDIASGSWWKINKQSDSPKDEINLDVFKIWLNHGEAPSEASYEYMVVPATSIKKLTDGDSRNHIRILSNTPEIQAVRHDRLNITQIVFYKSGAVEMKDGLVIHSDSPGILMVKMEDGKIVELSVSDPGRALKKFHFTVSTRIEKVAKNYKAQWNEVTKLSEVSIDLPEGVYAGQSSTIDLRQE